MTDDAAAPDDATLLTLLTEQTDLLLTRVAALDDAAAREPSLLPGWSRGHVLTHLARNADAIGNAAAGASLHRSVARYHSAEQRERDIQVGAGRPADQLVADVTGSSWRVLALLAAVPPAAGECRQPDNVGSPVRVGDLPWLRLREVTYHHADLDLGYGFVDLPLPVLRAGLLECPDRLAGAAPGLRLTCTFVDAEPLEVVLGDGSRRARAEAGAALAWLTGRTDGAAVTSEGPLPALPSWG